MYYHRRHSDPTPVHPRACGEHLKDERTLLIMSGSSPRLRGTFIMGVLGGRLIRFIPAPAGNIGLAFLSNGLTSVHPRACGEHWSAAAVLSYPIGSSPRLRGTYVVVLPSKERSRFIPAPAGNIHYHWTGYRACPVHPRACGEHEVDQIIHGVLIGSSPRLRGTFVCAAKHRV